MYVCMYVCMFKVQISSVVVITTSNKQASQQKDRIDALFCGIVRPSVHFSIVFFCPPKHLRVTFFRPFVEQHTHALTHYCCSLSLYIFNELQ